MWSAKTTNRSLSVSLCVGINWQRKEALGSRKQKEDLMLEARKELNLDPELIKHND